VQFPKFNIDPAKFVQFINIFFSLWEKLSSVTDVHTGQEPKVQGRRHQTATAAMMQVQEANVKHSYSSKQFQEEFSELLDMIYDLYYMHAPMSLIQESEGQKRIINKAQMRKRKRFILTGTTETSNKYVDRLEAESLYNLAKEDPIANRPECFIELLKSYGKDHPEKYIDPNINAILQVYEKNPQGFMAVFQQIMMAAQQAAAVAQAGKGNGGQTGESPGGGQPSQPIPGRAEGGGVKAGKPYVVGEEGPEVIVPDHDGEVIPNTKNGERPAPESSSPAESRATHSRRYRKSSAVRAPMQKPRAKDDKRPPLADFDRR
jgi:hypothetical protein